LSAKNEDHVKHAVKNISVNISAVIDYV